MQERAGVNEPRRVQRDHRSAADPIGRAGHVVPRSRCSCRGREHLSLSRASERTLFLVGLPEAIRFASLRTPKSGILLKISTRKNILEDILADSSPLGPL